MPANAQRLQQGAIDAVLSGVELAAERLLCRRDQLIDAAYGENIYVDDRTIDSHVKRIRKKFRTGDDDFEHIETLYGIGYRYKEH